MRQYAGREVVVHLPPGYDPSRADPYPLLVLHDGQNLLAARPEARGGSWHVDTTLDRLTAAGRIPPLVLAGIDHASEDRINEFSPTPGRQPGAGQAEDYARLVLDRILPALAADVHVRTDFEGLGLGGSSMGGLVTLWMAATFPGRFSRLLVMSPSIWWDRRMILKYLRQRGLAPSTRIWLDAGRKEGRIVARDARDLRDLLVEQRHPAFKYFEDPAGDHSESSWARRLPAALEWLYEGSAGEAGAASTTTSGAGAKRA